MLQAQGIFTKVARHLLKQGAVSQNDEAECVYRNEEGLKCAIGCLIKDKHYKRSLEGFTPGRGPECGPINCALEKSGVRVQGNEDLLCELQILHDGHPINFWKKKLRAVAKEFKLRWPRGL